MKTQLQRFEEKINKTDSCWLWTGCILWHGYGQTYWNKKKEYAHRVSYWIRKGEIPEGLILDHLCRVRSCVNPDHLEAVTYQTNVRRGVGVGKRGLINEGRCINGHKYDKENTYLAPNNPYKFCRTCSKARLRKIYEKKRSQRSLTKI